MKKHPLFEVLDAIYSQAKLQYGSAIKGRWLHDGDGCPGCGKEITATKWKKKKAMSLNAFIYREHGVLIGYMLCGKCASHIFAESETNPHSHLPIHDEIEKNLKAAFVKHLGH
ncbi:MAG: hypothetical protein AB7Q37_07730 [Pyrinomonadaceae bacterium]